jgi:predicted acetyltransferase
VTEIRAALSKNDVRASLDVVFAAFGDRPDEDSYEREAKRMPANRVLLAFDGASPVGTAAAYPLELTVPGGTLPAAGVTWVGVIPSHRRRGLMTQMMRRQLDDLHERGDPLAILWASESLIYGRFGYGMTAPMLTLDGERARFAFRDDPGPSGSGRLVEREEAARVFPPLFDERRRITPGMFARDDTWWSTSQLADPERWRQGAGPKFFAVVELDGAPAGYAIYRLKEHWDQGIPRYELRISDACAVSRTAVRELWRFLFGIDLVARVKQFMFDPNAELPLMVEDPRSLQLALGDGLWLRLVDVEAALRGRTYADGQDVVIEVRDEQCPWNAGRYRVGPEVERTDDEAELELDVADLACAYLGAFDFHRLARAGRARELRPGALERASLLFRSERIAYCPEEF